MTSYLREDEYQTNQGLLGLASLIRQFRHHGRHHAKSEIDQSLGVPDEFASLFYSIDSTERVNRSHPALIKSAQLSSK